jgi:SAM-dependent methyltransferase
VQDALFAEPRLARIYDVWEGERIDLPHYLAIVAELGARSVLDVGCGTGNWASMLAERGFEVVGLDPAAASLEVARAKPGAQRVRWIHGDVTSLPALAVDLATMTGNVSNVFLTQQEWLATLGGIRAALRPGGYLVFESVDPAGQPWLTWNRERTYARRRRSSMSASARSGASALRFKSLCGYEIPVSSLLNGAPHVPAVRCGGQRSCLAACGRPLCECGPIGAYEATAGLSTCSHHWRKLVGVEFCGVRWTPLSRPSFFAQAISVYP